MAKDKNNNVDASKLDDVINGLDIDVGIPPVDINTDELNTEAIDLAKLIVENFCKDEEPRSCY